MANIRGQAAESSVYVRSFTLCNCSKGSFQREFLYSTAANIPQFMTQKPILPAAPLGKYNFQMRILHTSSKLLNTITQLNMDVQQDLRVLFKALYSFWIFFGFLFRFFSEFPFGIFSGRFDTSVSPVAFFASELEGGSPEHDEEGEGGGLLYPVVVNYNVYDCAHI